MNIPNKLRVCSYLLSLQNSICEAFSALDGNSFIEDTWEREEGGGGHSRVLVDSHIIEKSGVNFSHIFGHSMPDSATANRPELVGRRFEAMGVSLVIHPYNPYIPTSHMNIRFFIAEKEGEEPIWWFGGGYDLTPYYGNQEDCIHWHQTAKNACEPFGDDLYHTYKRWCDEYFYLKHRDESRGIGGLFFDDLNESGFEYCFSLTQSIGNSFIKAYYPIVERRKDITFTERERRFQLYRRGRYVEFNLLLDRGTLFGLQTKGRIESVLMSLPPLVSWEYNYQAEENSPEADLMDVYLQKKNWL